MMADQTDNDSIILKAPMTESDFVAWLNERFGPNNVARKERIFFLVACNNGFYVTQFGITQDGKYFPNGLERPDALELIEWKAFLDGIAEGSGINVYRVMVPLYNEFVAARKAEVDSDKPV